MTKKKGRPTDCTNDLVDEVCLQIAEGKSLRQICKAENVPSKTTLLRWLLKPNDEKYKYFCDQYARAIELRPDALIDEYLFASREDVERYVDAQGNMRLCNVDVNRLKNNADNVKWLLGKLSPQKYGKLAETIETESQADTLSKLIFDDMPKANKK